MLPLDLPGLRAVNAYLVADGTGWVLVDTGIFDPSPERDHGWDDVVAALRACGARPSDLGRLVCTHHHADHYGMAARLCEAAHCDLVMHEDADRDLDLYREPRRRAERVRAALESHGIDPDQAADLVGGEDWTRYVSGVVSPHVALADRAELRIGGRDWAVLHTPGHARSHVCLWSERDRVLISGDHLLPGITPHIDVGAEAEDPLGEYLAALERIEKLDPLLVLPGHGRPFRGGAERARATLRHHERRLGAVLQVIRQEPQPAAAISDAIFGSELMEWHRRLALGEALAHLTYLERRGEVRRIKEGDAVMYVKRARQR